MSGPHKDEGGGYWGSALAAEAAEEWARNGGGLGALVECVAPVVGPSSSSPDMFAFFVKRGCQYLLGAAGLMAWCPRATASDLFLSVDLDAEGVPSLIMGIPRANGEKESDWAAGLPGAPRASERFFMTLEGHVELVREECSPEWDDTSLEAATMSLVRVCNRLTRALGEQVPATLARPYARSRTVEGGFDVQWGYDLM